jgi:ABC-type branched-subunit amino acid transport system substrate-binding protein
VATLLLSAGCPSTRTPNHQPATGPVSPNAHAQETFEAAEAKLQAGDAPGGRTALEQFVVLFPSDPLEPVARLDAGRAAWAQGDYAGAKNDLEPLAEATDASQPVVDVPEDVAQNARLYLGLSLVHVGDPAGAIQLLKPLEPVITSVDDATDLHAALAQAFSLQGDVTASLAEYDLFYPSASNAEKAYIRQRVQTLVAGLSHEGALQAYGAVERDGLSAAQLARRLAAEAAAAGDTDGMRKYQTEAVSASHASGLDQAVAPGQADPGTIGLLVPLSGPAQAVGESALRGALLAAGELAGDESAGASDEQQRGPVLLVRDSGGDANAATRAVDDLSANGVIAIVGPLDRNAAAAAAARASLLGVPLLSLAVSQAPASAPAEPAPVGAAVTLQVLHAPDARGRALAMAGVKAGVRRFAILRPDNDYGKLVADAFARQAAAAGAIVVDEEVYDPKATSFVAQAHKAAVAGADAVFVPDAARKLELVAPALALAGLWSVPPGGQAPKHLKAMLLLSTAEGLTLTLVQNAGRYVQGAILAPGFYPDDADPHSAPFVLNYRDLYAGTDPGLFDAAAYGAVRAIMDATTAGQTTRAGLTEQLIGPTLTPEQSTFAGGGVIPAFAPDGSRADPPALYEVTGDAIHLIPPGSDVEAP